MAKGKLKKSKDLTQCCRTCSFLNKSSSDGKLSCSLDGKSVEADDVCRSFGCSTTEECVRCHRKITHKTRDDYVNSIVRFSMDSGGGSSSGQNFHLCRKCETEVFSLFQDFLDGIRG